jgi:D-threo-aldose 1-dehydrogenase
VLDVCAARGIAVLNAAPFAGGILAKGSGSLRRITYQEADDAALSRVQDIEQICASHDVATGAAALQFSLRDVRIASTVVGVSNPERVKQALDWAAEGIADRVFEELSMVEFSTLDPEADRQYSPG